MIKRRIEWSRRQFVVATAVAARSATALWSRASQPEASQICIFSKHLQWLDFEEMAVTAAKLGFDGVDLTVRPGGHVLPERVEQDLPRAVGAIKAAGLTAPMMTTAINDPNAPHTERILETAAGLGIRFYRLGYFRYEDSTDVLETLSRAERNLEGLARLNEKYALCGDYQNHAGKDYFGASIWDLWAATRKLDPDRLGCQFDLRHATVESAFNWPVAFRLISSRTHTIVAKDFRWETSGSGATIANCPLGEGVADFESFFALLKESGFRGPVSTHFEYPLGGANRGSRELTENSEVVLSAMRKDLATLKLWLRDARLRGD